MHRPEELTGTADQDRSFWYVALGAILVGLVGAALTIKFCC